MNWFSNFITSSIGKKWVMSLTGLFLILFLTVHLVGNFQLFIDDNGLAFNSYSYMMTTNPLIKTVSYGLYFFILLHAIQGIMLALKNKQARSNKYAVAAGKTGSWESKNMAMLGLLILGFLILHMGDFWFKMKFGAVDYVSYEGLSHPVKDLYAVVEVSFQNLGIVIAYVVGQIAIALHLRHGFESAFQTLGVAHKKYTPIIKAIGNAYSILIPLGFAIIPLYYYFVK